MAEARDRFGAESVLPYHYGGSNGLLTNEFGDARFFRRFGASRLARTLCAAPTGAAATAMYGKMAGVAYDDYAHARLIVVWGCNPSASGIHLVPHIKQAQKDGARLVVIDPRTDPARADGRPAPARPAGHGSAGRARADPRAVRPGLGGCRRFSRRTPWDRDSLRQAAEPWTIDRAATEAGVSARDLALAGGMVRHDLAGGHPVRLGPGAQPQRRVGDAGDPGAAGGRGQVRRARRRLHDEQLRRVGHPGRGRSSATPPPATRVVNMNQLGRALPGLPGSARRGAVRLQLQSGGDRAGSESRASAACCARTCSRSSTNRS